MFTGIIEEVGTLRSVRRGAHSAVLTIGASRVLSDLKIGDSVAVNGVCLTATSLDDGGFTADVMPETLRRSSLGALGPGRLRPGQPGESGAGHGRRRPLRRAHRLRPY